ALRWLVHEDQHGWGTSRRRLQRLARPAWAGVFRPRPGSLCHPQRRQLGRRVQTESSSGRPILRLSVRLSRAEGGLRNEKRFPAASTLVSEETRSVRERFHYNWGRSVRTIHRTD